MCPRCGSDRFTLLGLLGKVTWYRCRACGTDVPDVEDETDG